MTNDEGMMKHECNVLARAQNRMSKSEVGVITVWKWPAAFLEGYASNAEARMTKDEGMTKHECSILALARTHARNRISEVP